MLARTVWTINENFSFCREVIVFSMHIATIVQIAAKRSSTEINFEEDMNFTTTQDNLLTNINYKERFIAKLTRK